MVLQINSKFITFATKELFVSTNFEVSHHSVVFINDTGEIYCGGKRYSGLVNGNDAGMVPACDGKGSSIVSTSDYLLTFANGSPSWKKLDSYVTLRGDLTITGSKIFTSAVKIQVDSDISLNLVSKGKYSAIGFVCNQDSDTLTKLNGYFLYRGDANYILTDSGWHYEYKILHSGNSSIKDGVITINNTSITPLTSHQSLSNYVTLNGDQTITGKKTFDNSIVMGTSHYIYGINEAGGSMLHFDGERTVIGSSGASSTKSTNIRSNTGNVTINENKTILHTGNSHITNGVITINGSSITPLTAHQSLANYVTLNSALTITGLKTFESNSSTTGISLILKNKGWEGNMSTAMDFYNGRSYTVPNARIETKMAGNGRNGGTLIFYTLLAHAETNPNPNGLTERFRICDDGTSKIAGQLEVTKDVTAPTFIGNLTGTASNADLLDDLHSTDFVRQYGVVGANFSTGNWLGYTYATEAHGGPVAGGVVSTGGNNGMLLVGSHTGNRLYYRGINSGAFTDWKQVAFVDSDITGNAATATHALTADKLKTARTLTIGNSAKTFDGSADVSWSLHDILYNSDKRLWEKLDASWNITTPGVYPVAASGDLTGEGNPETNGGGYPYKWGQLIVSKAGDAGLVLFYISHYDSSNANYGIKYRTGYYNTYVDKWARLLDSTNYNKYVPTLTGTGASGDWNINSATSTKLATSRKIWGQSFDGTADVSGSLSNVTSINSKSDTALTISTSSTSGIYFRYNKDDANSLVLLSTAFIPTAASKELINLGTSSYKWKGVYALNFYGNIDGSYVNKLTNYTKATTVGSIATTDSLNTALGKLEYKADTAYDWYKSVTETDNDDVINKWSEIVDFIDGVKEGTDITDEFVTRKTDLTITGIKTFSKVINITNSAGSWVSGMTNAAIKYDSLNALNSGSYHPIIGIKTYKENVVNFGAYVHDVGFYGYKKGRTENSYDWLFIFNSETGAITHTGKNITAVKFIGNLNNTLTFSAGAFSAKTYNNSAAVTVSIPTHTSHLTNNSGFLTQHQSLDNYVTLNGTQTITGVKTFSTQQKFTVAQGTSPFTVTSTTKVSNLNSDLLDGYDSSRFLRAKDWVTNPGQDADTLELNMMCFTYSNNAPYTGTIIYFAGATGGNYGLLLNASYTSSGYLSFRSRNGDSGTWQDWSTILTLHNYTGYVNTTNFPGLNKTGTVTSVKVGSTSYSPSSGVISLPAYPTSLKNSNAIKFKNTDETEVSYDGSVAIDLTGGVNYATSSTYLKVTSLTTELDILQTGVRAYSGIGADWTGDVTSMRYAAILSFGSPNRGWQLWCRRGEGHIYYRNGLEDSSGWNTERTILDSGNYTSYLGYIGTTAVQASSAALALTGITTLKMSGSLSIDGGVDVYRKISIGNGTSGKHVAIHNSGGIIIDEVDPGRIAELSLYENSSRLGGIGVYSGGPIYIDGTNKSHKIALENLTTITKTLTVTKDWMDTGIKYTDLDTGTYAIQVYSHTTGNSIYYCYWSGIMTWYGSTTNSSESDEILLHRGAHGSNENTIYLRTINTTATDGRHMRLQIAANKNWSSATFTFKFKKLI